MESNIPSETTKEAVEAKQERSNKERKLAKNFLNDEAKLARDIANESYSQNRKNIGSYEYLPDYSNENTAVYKSGNKIKIGMRGSTTGGDWVRNLLIAGGQENYDKDFTADRKLYDRLKNDFSDSVISTTGHSRGGKRARNLAFKKGLEGDAFNEASSPFSISQSFQKNYCEVNDCKRFNSYRTKKDPVSGAGYLGKNSGQYGKNTNFDSVKGFDDIANSHSLINFY